MLFVGAVVLLHGALALVVRRWWVLLLPALAVVCAVPAGYPDANRGEPFPIWFGLALVAAPVGIATAALALAVRRVADRRGSGD